MPAQAIDVCPPNVLSAADSATVQLEQSARPPAGAEATGGEGSWLSDATAAALTLKVATRAGELSAELAGDGPAAETTTKAGIRELIRTDEVNGLALRVVAQEDMSRWA